MEFVERLICYITIGMMLFAYLRLRTAAANAYLITVYRVVVLMGKADEDQIEARLRENNAYLGWSMTDAVLEKAVKVGLLTRGWDDELLCDVYKPDKTIVEAMCI